MEARQGMRPRPPRREIELEAPAERAPSDEPPPDVDVDPAIRRGAQPVTAGIPDPGTPAATQQQPVANTTAATAAAGAALPFRGTYASAAGFGDKDSSLWANGHTGIDYSLPLGTDVLSMDNDGIVTAVGNDGGYGLRIVVSYPWGDVILGHLNSAGVREGERVSKGQIIGKSGRSGKSTGPHLHVEVRKDGVAVDPQRFMGGQAMPRAAAAPGTPGAPTEKLDHSPTLTGQQRIPGNVPEDVSRNYPDVTRSDQPNPLAAWPLENLLKGARTPEDKATPESDRLASRPFAGLQTGDMTPAEGRYYFPWEDASRGGMEQTRYNLMTGMGVNPDSGNPWASFLEKQIDPLYYSQGVMSTLGGANAPWDENAKRNMAMDVGGLLRQGRTSAITDMPETLRRLVGVTKQSFDEKDEGPLAMLATRLAEGGGTQAAALLARLLAPGVSPFLENYVTPTMERKLKAWRQQAPANPNMTPLEFLTRGWA